MVCDSQSCLATYSVSSSVVQSVKWQLELSYNIQCTVLSCSLSVCCVTVLSYSVWCDNQSCLNRQCVQCFLGLFCDRAVLYDTLYAVLSYTLMYVSTVTAFLGCVV